jgi:hypothetical protein
MYIPLSTEQMKKMPKRHIENDYLHYVIAHSMVGFSVVKCSGNLFKSKSKANTAKGVSRNPYTHKWGLTFEEDESIVDVTHLRINI